MLLLSVMFDVFAGKKVDITLDNDKKNKEVIEVANFNIFLELIDVDDNGNVNVLIELENLDESKGLLLFDRFYSEKSLKKMRPKIKFDKIYPGTKGRREISSCAHVKNAILLQPTQKKMIMKLSANDGDVLSVILPIYIIEDREKNFILWKKNEYILLQKEVADLNIKIKLKPDETYLRLERDCEKLLEEFQNALFCTNKRHHPSLAKQKELFQNKIDSLLGEINNVIVYNGWFSTDRRYKMYNALKMKLDSIRLEDKEGDCGKHIEVHKCKYCNVSLLQISHNLDDIYQEIYSSNNRSKTKAEHLKNVNAMYNCAKRRPGWRNSDYNNKITRLYHEINQF